MLTKPDASAIAIAEFPVVICKPQTWENLAAIEPMLSQIERDAMSLRRGKRRSVRLRYYERFKRRVSCYVGWHARDSRLASSTCYEIAISRIVDALEGSGLRKARGKTAQRRRTNGW
jgi:hypothetical protein